MINKDIIIKRLVELTIKKETNEIHKLLNEIDERLKGAIFEEYLKKLYEGNGWLVNYNKNQKFDYGADLLLLHPQNLSLSIIVQAKNHIKPLTWTKTRDEIRRFEEEASKRYNCNQFILLSISGFTKNSSKLSEFNVKLESWDYIEGLIINYDTKRNEPDIELYNHNKLAYKKIAKSFENNTSVCVVQATGTGKSHLIKKLLSSQLESNKIVLAPTTFIIEQLKETVSWCAQNTKFMTYAKAMNLTKDEIIKLNFSLLILDEFHRVGAEKWSEGVKRIITYSKGLKLFGTSATPIRYLEGRDMAQEIFNSNIAHRLDLSEAIARKILPTPIYITALYSLDNDINTLLNKINTSYNTDKEKDRLIKKLNKYTLNFNKINGIPNILKKHISETDNKFIIFCKNIEHLKEAEWLVKSWFQKAGLKKRIETFSIYHEEPDNEKTLNYFRKAYRDDTMYLLFSIEKLSEGIHVNDISGVILLRKTISGNVYLQQIGRAFNTKNYKSPIIFDFVNNFRNITSSFIDDVNNALIKENDRRIKVGLPISHPELKIHDYVIEFLHLYKEIENNLYTKWDYRYKELVDFKKVNGHCRVPITYSKNLELAYWVNTQRTAYIKNELDKEKIEKLNHIGFIWSVFDDYWDSMYNELVLYKKINGDCLVPDKYSDNQQLANWVKVQRNKKNLGQLDEENTILLDEIGFIWNVLEHKWDTMYKKLLNLIKTNSMDFIDSDLSKWMKNQRTYFRNNKLSDEKIKRLNEIGFVWEPYQNKWDIRFTELLEYKALKGDCNVPQNYEVNKKLATWVIVQRQDYKYNKLSDEKTKKLDKIGFIWSPHEYYWNKMYGQLLLYLEQFGNTLVPSNWDGNPELANWVRSQREQYKKGKLSDIQIVKLNQIDFIWEINEYLWKTMYNELVRYVYLYGTTKVPRNNDEFNKLAMWIKKQKHLHKSNLLKKERLDLLKDLGLEF